MEQDAALNRDLQNVPRVECASTSNHKRAIMVLYAYLPS